MTDLTPVETLQAAVDVLKQMPWISPVDPRDHMFVTLYATIDAQIAILEAARDDYTQYGGKPSKFFANDMALARSILGAVQA